jgi:protein SCO1/2
MLNVRSQILVPTVTCLLAALLFAPIARAGLTGPEPLAPGIRDAIPEALKNITVNEHFNGALPLDLSFVDDTNHRVKLGDYFHGNKPILLQLGYYSCPMLCDLVSRGITKSLKNVSSLTIGKDYDIIFISIDPNENWTLAQKKKISYVLDYDRPGSQDGWHFLTGGQPEIDAVARACGFEYKWVASAQQYSHPAVVMLCTPEGKLSRYLYGVKFEEETLRLGLVEASEGKIGSTSDHWILKCFVYDGKQGKYALSAMRLMRFGGVLTVIVLSMTLVVLFRRESRRKTL